MAKLPWRPDRVPERNMQASTSVLIVEDEFLVAMQLEDILTEAGYHVIGIVPDRAALADIGGVPQVALVDVNLRDGASGPDIARNLSDDFGTTIVYVTANPSQIGRPAPTAVGIVHKPFSARTILAAIAFATEDPMIEPAIIPGEFNLLPRHVF